MLNTTIQSEFTPCMRGNHGNELFICIRDKSMPEGYEVYIPLEQARILEKKLVDAIKGAIILECNSVAEC